MRVIVVEDDRTTRGAIQDWMERRGHSVSILSDAESFCTERICRCADKEHCADILLCDMKLPGRSGLDVAGALRRKACRIPKIGIMSGWWTQETMDKARDLKVEAFRKPGEMGRLLEWIADHAKTLSADAAKPA